MSETMGQIIRRLRKERNLTQEELAQQLNVTFQAVSRWENGTGMPDISQVVPLASVFGVTTDALFNIEGTNATDEAYRIVNEANAMDNVEKSVMFYLDMISPTNKMRIEALRKNPPLVDRGITDITVSKAHMKSHLTEKLASPELTFLHDSEKFKELCSKVAAL